MVFAKAVLEQVRLPIKWTQARLDEIKKKYPFPQPEGPITIPTQMFPELMEAYVKICPDNKVKEIKTLLLAMKKTPILSDLAKMVVSQSIPQDFARSFMRYTTSFAYRIGTTPIEKLEDVLKANGINVKKELVAIKEMRELAKADGESVEIGRKYFDRQYSQDPLEALRRLFGEFGKFPSEILADDTIEKAFVNEDFMTAWERIERGVSCGNKRIQLRESELYRAPYNIGEHRSVTMIDLCEMKLQAIPNSIIHLKNLQQIFIRKNQLGHINEAILGLEKLKGIYLDYNDITCLPESMDCLKNLAYIQLQNNPSLKRLPNSLQYLTKLKGVNAQNCPALEVPEALVRRLLEIGRQAGGTSIFYTGLIR